jgi:hypothetical protein
MRQQSSQRRIELYVVASHSSTTCLPFWPHTKRPTFPYWHGRCIYSAVSPNGTDWGNEHSMRNTRKSELGAGTDKRAGRRRGTTARERNHLPEQKLARSAHLPQKLAN